MKEESQTHHQPQLQLQQQQQGGDGVCGKPYAELDLGEMRSLMLASPIRAMMTELRRRFRFVADRRYEWHRSSGLWAITSYESWNDIVLKTFETLIEDITCYSIFGEETWENNVSVDRKVRMAHDYRDFMFRTYASGTPAMWEIIDATRDPAHPIHLEVPGLFEPGFPASLNITKHMLPISSYQIVDLRDGTMRFIKPGDEFSLRSHGDICRHPPHVMYIDLFLRSMFGDDDGFLRKLQMCLGFALTGEAPDSNNPFAPHTFVWQKPNPHQRGTGRSRLLKNVLGILSEFHAIVPGPMQRVGERAYELGIKPKQPRPWQPKPKQPKPAPHGVRNVSFEHTEPCVPGVVGKQYKTHVKVNGKIYREADDDGVFVIPFERSMMSEPCPCEKVRQTYPDGDYKESCDGYCRTREWLWYPHRNALLTWMVTGAVEWYKQRS